VLLLIYPHSRTAHPHLLLTLRDAEMQYHAGQVSFPGGAVEPGESYDEAALREAQEETGVNPRTVRILGELSPLHVPVSRFVLHPRIGVTDSRPDFRPKTGEVERILEIALDRLRDPSRLGLEKRRFRPGKVDVPFFALDGEKVWGATAMVLSEFLCLLGRPPDPWKPGKSDRG
jgi:8-oxo-dGTP pyrophosphatase MutT (NUDIX family)